MWPLPVAAIAIAWLIPNHYPPWPAAWADGWVLCLVAIALVTMPVGGRMPRFWAAAIGVAVASVTAQWVGGRIDFTGDAVITLHYLAAFGAALLAGHALAQGRADQPLTAVDLWALACTAVALVSVGIALVQWTGAFSLGIYGTDLPPGARPYANLAQANQFASVAFLGLCSVAMLREAGHVGPWGFASASAFLVLGMVMSGSRAAWLELGAAGLLATALHKRCGARLGPAQLLAVAAGFTVLTVLWPDINEALLLSGGRPVTEQIDGGARLPLWVALIDAVGREPLWGWGWAQVTHAQLAVALDHAPVHRMFMHSHNLLLDLVLWAGIPMGATIVVLAAAALIAQARRLRDARGLWLLVGSVGLLAHSMVEYPLAYAYFLVPFGISLGALHALAPSKSALSPPLAATRLAGIALLVLFALIAHDYVDAEQGMRLLRLQTSRIGTARVDAEPPRLLLLTQLAEFQRFARTEARPGMAPAEVERMRAVARRYPYPASLLRFALAAGLNGRPSEAESTLARLCSIHLPARCDEARAAWQVLGDKHPVLRAIRAP